MTNPEPQSVDTLMRQLKQVRARLIVLTCLKGIMSVVWTLALSTLLVAGLDEHHLLPALLRMPLRIFLGAILLALSIYWLSRIYVWTDLIRVATYLEERAPFDQQLLVVTEYYQHRQNYSSSPALVSLIARRLLSRTELTDYCRIVRPLLFLTMLLVILASTVSVVGWVSHIRSRPFLSLLWPGVTPRASVPFQWHMPSAPIISEPNDPVRLFAYAQGRPPPVAELTINRLHDDSIEKIFSSSIYPVPTEDQRALFEMNRLFPGPGRYQYRIQADHLSSSTAEVFVGSIPKINQIEVHIVDPDGVAQRFRFDSPIATVSVPRRARANITIQHRPCPVEIEITAWGRIVPIERQDHGSFSFATQINRPGTVQTVVKNQSLPQIKSICRLELTWTDPPNDQPPPSTGPPSDSHPDTSPERQRYRIYRAMMQKRSSKNRDPAVQPRIELTQTIRYLQQLLDDIEDLSRDYQQAEPTPEGAKLREDERRMVSAKMDFHLFQLNVCRQLFQQNSTAESETSRPPNDALCAAVDQGVRLLEAMDQSSGSMQYGARWLQRAQEQIKQSVSVMQQALDQTEPPEGKNTELMRKAAALSHQLHDAVQAGLADQQLNNLLREAARLAAQMQDQGLISPDHLPEFLDPNAVDGFPANSANPVFLPFNRTLTSQDILTISSLLQPDHPSQVPAINLGPASLDGDLRYQTVEAEFFRQAVDLAGREVLP